MEYGHAGGNLLAAVGSGSASGKEAEAATSARFVPITLLAAKASPSGGLIATVSARSGN